jgi:hypothetical protein
LSRADKQGNDKSGSQDANDCVGEVVHALHPAYKHGGKTIRRASRARFFFVSVPSMPIYFPIPLAQFFIFLLLKKSLGWLPSKPNALTFWDFKRTLRPNALLDLFSACMIFM